MDKLSIPFRISDILHYELPLTRDWRQGFIFINRKFYRFYLYRNRWSSMDKFVIKKTRIEGAGTSASTNDPKILNKRKSQAEKDKQYKKKNGIFKILG